MKVAILRWICFLWAAVFGTISVALGTEIPPEERNVFTVGFQCGMALLASICLWIYLAETRQQEKRRAARPKENDAANPPNP